MFEMQENSTFTKTKPSLKRIIFSIIVKSGYQPNSQNNLWPKYKTKNYAITLTRKFYFHQIHRTMIVRKKVQYLYKRNTSRATYIKWYPLKFNKNFHNPSLQFIDSFKKESIFSGGIKMMSIIISSLRTKNT